MSLMIASVRDLLGDKTVASLFIYRFIFFCSFHWWSTLTRQWKPRRNGCWWCWWWSFRRAKHNKNGSSYLLVVYSASAPRTCLRYAVFRCCTRFFRDDLASLTLFHLESNRRVMRMNEKDPFLPFWFRSISFLLFLRCWRWISSDGSMCLLVQSFKLNRKHQWFCWRKPIYTYRAGFDPGFDKAWELFRVQIGVLFFQRFHVGGHVQAKDVLTMNISIELFALSTVAWKSSSTRRKRKQMNVDQIDSREKVHQKGLSSWTSEEMTEIKVIYSSSARIEKGEKTMRCKIRKGRKVQ